MHSGSANVILRNNRNLLKSRQKNKFVHKPGKYSGSTKKDRYDHVVLKPQVLKEIRERLKKERKQLFKKRMILFVITLVLLLGLLLF